MSKVPIPGRGVLAGKFQNLVPGNLGRSITVLYLMILQI